MNASINGNVQPGSKPRSPVRSALFGFALGAVLPVAFGIYAMSYDIAYRAALPKFPNRADCGMPMLGALMMIFFIGPTCGVAGAIVGRMITAIVRRFE